MNYQQTLHYLYTKLPMYQRQGSVAFKKDLTNIIKLCNALGNPQKSFKSIHVAGTNGKGSSSHIIASILQEKGFKIGLYSSPHLKNFTERIKVNGNEIDEDFVTFFVNKIRHLINKISPSFFEITVAMCFAFFQKEAVDYAIIETGLGGRLDSTNILNPEISLITNISMDHEAMLGNSMKEIAFEKAGIIKENTPIVISESQSEVKGVFIEKSKEVNASIYFADQDFTYKYIKEKVEILENTHSYVRFTPFLKGDHQVKNIIGVLKVLNLLVEKQGFKLLKEELIKGIENVTKNTGLKGRWQQISDVPLIICDIGHNKAGLELLVNQIKDQVYDKLHMVIGTVNDKKIADILNQLPKDANYYFCKPNVPRGLDVDILAEEASKLGLKGNTYSSVQVAIDEAKSKASVNDFIFIGGSTFVVAEIEEI